jgi:hypothetical protein
MSILNATFHPAIKGMRIAAGSKSNTSSTS